jgi:hypothetical protein
MNLLASLYQAQARYAEAEKLNLHLLETSKRVLGDEHPDTLLVMGRLASLLMAQGRSGEAEPLMLQTLESSKRVLGDEHPSTLLVMGGLANIYRSQGRYAEAEPLMLETVQLLKRVRGEEHPSTLGVITNLGLLYNSMELFEEAANTLEVSLPIKRRVLGVHHPWTSYAMEGLVTAYEGMGRSEEALTLQRERVGLLVAAANEPNATSSTLLLAAGALLSEGFEETLDPERALAFAQRACALAEANGSGAGWRELSTLALAQHLTGDDAAAVRTQRRTLARIQEDAEPKQFGEQAERLADYEAGSEDG